MISAIFAFSMGNAQFIFEGSLLFEDLPGSLPYWFVHYCWVRRKLIT
jgi:hypothetical protein